MDNVYVMFVDIFENIDFYDIHTIRVLLQYKLNQYLIISYFMRMIIT
ncbi:hypothetical protein NPIRD3C_1897 [Nitrosopumilus piranensis]|uniref:Uncharacterized protein n=1 Tax=Nitrosopumilus piranensis TaxID=1582439 RepID=A0A0C5CD33_9ARCH|nr:hypothetical protein NPIRD3C_1897 [Nitrosopumilus piranensis]